MRRMNSFVHLAPERQKYFGRVRRQAQAGAGIFSGWRGYVVVERAWSDEAGLVCDARHGGCADEWRALKRAED